MNIEDKLRLETYYRKEELRLEAHYLKQELDMNEFYKRKKEENSNKSLSVTFFEIIAYSSIFYLAYQILF